MFGSNKYKKNWNFLPIKMEASQDDKEMIADLYRPYIDNFDMSKLKVGKREKKEHIGENGNKSVYYTHSVAYDGNPVLIKK